MNNQKTNLKLLKTKSILYVEDEDNIREDLTQTLQLLSKEVFSFSNANDALKFFTETKTDIIISDISLGDLDGLSFIKLIREKDKKTPVILLSAHTEMNYLLDATKLKLVEYLVKPVIFEDLKSALLLALKEIEFHQQRFVEISDNLKYDTLYKILYENDTAKKLSSSETTLLDFFIKHKDRTLSTQEIKNSIWEDSYYATDAALKSLLHKLRNKIGKNSIKNISGIGYYIKTK